MTKEFERKKHNTSKQTTNEERKMERDRKKYLKRDWQRTRERAKDEGRG